jgi:hypothetical protein
MPNITRVKRVAEFIGAVEFFARSWSLKGPFWFRGQANSEWLLIPKFFRLPKGDEGALRIDFERAGMELLSGGRQPANHWEWYFLAQHHGLPTRLLDWTEGALLALYFALRDRASLSDKIADAAVWMLDPKWLNKRSGIRPYLARPGPETVAWLPENPEHIVEANPPIVIAPPYVARRLAAQRSQFVLFGNDRTALSRREDDPDGRLEKIEIMAAACEYMKAELLLLGICETTVFQDLEGLARELEGKYGGR